MKIELLWKRFDFSELILNTEPSLPTKVWKIKNKYDSVKDDIHDREREVFSKHKPEK